MSTILAFASTVLLFLLIIVWPSTSLAVALVGGAFIHLIIYYLGLQGGVTFMIFGMLIFSVIIFILRKRVWPFSFTKTEYWAFAVVLLMLTSLLYTTAPLYGKEKTMRFIGTCIILMTVARFLVKDCITLRITMKTLGWFSIASMTLNIILMVLLGDLMMEGGRLGGKESSLAMGWSSAAAAVMMLYLVIGPTRLWTKIIASGGILAAMVMVVGSGSRGPFLALVLGVVLAFLSVRSMVPSLIGIAMIGLVAYVSLNYLAPEQGRDRIAHGLGEHALAESGRPEFYRVGIQLYATNPVLGKGAGSFAPAFGRGDERAYPHNMLIEVASETGTLGLLFLGLMLWFSLKSILLLRFSLRSISIEGKILQYLFWLGLANAMLSFDLPDQRILFCAIGLLAAVPNLHRLSQNEYMLEDTSLDYTLEMHDEDNYMEPVYG